MKYLYVFMLISVLFVTNVFAELPINRAVGYDSGLSIRCKSGSYILQGIFGFRYSNFDASRNYSRLDATIGMNVLKPMWVANKYWLNLRVNKFIGFLANAETRTHSKGLVTSTRIHIGIEPEIFLFDNLSITTKFGIIIDFQGNKRDSTGGLRPNSHEITARTFGGKLNLIESAAFHLYF